MRYDYLVKHNGVYYPRGTEVPSGNVAVEKSTATEPIKKETPKREEIDAMNYMALKKLARDNGIEHDNKIKLADLKELLFKHYGI